MSPADHVSASLEPRSEAGRRLLRWSQSEGLPLTDETRHTINVAILEVEEQAATEARRELLAKVEGLYESRHVVGYAEGKRWVRKSDLLALFEESDRG